MPFATSTDGVRIFYTTMGEGERLILAHGGTHTWESWQDLGYVAALKDRFQLILFDARGHGRSDMPHEVAAYAFPQLVDDVLAVVDSLGIARFHFCGYSFTAQLSFHLAARVPERVQTFVAYGGHPYPPSAEDRAGIDEFNVILQGGMSAWVQEMEIRGVFAQYPNPTARRERLLATDADAQIALNNACRADQGCADALAHITAPCLLIAGERDVANDLARQAAKELPVADFVSVGGIGHAMVHAQTILPYVRAFYERFAVPTGSPEPATR